MRRLPSQLSPSEPLGSTTLTDRMLFGVSASMCSHIVYTVLMASQAAYVYCAPADIACLCLLLLGAVDALFGTLPARSSSVPLTEMARTAHGSNTHVTATSSAKHGPSGGRSSSNVAPAGSVVLPAVASNTGAAAVVVDAATAAAANTAAMPALSSRR